jgi:hypothetical protein
LMTTIDWLIRSFFLIRFPLWLHQVVICDRYLLDAIVDISYRSTWEKVSDSLWIRSSSRPGFPIHSSRYSSSTTET